jgi:hypothetical protein
MERALRTLTMATVAIWSVYLLYIVTVATRLSEWLSPPEVIPTILLAVAVLAASAWVGFWSASRLPARTALLGQMLVMALGCLFLGSVLIGRAT